MIPNDKLKTFSQLVNQLIGLNEPTDEELEKRHLTEVYDELHNLKNSLSQADFYA